MDIDVGAQVVESILTEGRQKLEEFLEFTLEEEMPVTLEGISQAESGRHTLLYWAAVEAYEVAEGAEMPEAAAAEVARALTTAAHDLLTLARVAAIQSQRIAIIR